MVPTAQRLVVCLTCYKLTYVILLLSNLILFEHLSYASVLKRIPNKISTLWYSKLLFTIFNQQEKKNKSADTKTHSHVRHDLIFSSSFNKIMSTNKHDQFKTVFNTEIRSSQPSGLERHIVVWSGRSEFESRQGLVQTKYTIL